MSEIDRVTTSSPVRIAVITGDSDLADWVAPAVEPLGHIEIVLGARQALGRIHDGDFDVALLDMELPQAAALVRCVDVLASGFPLIGLTTHVDDAADLGIPVLHRILTVGAMLRVAVARAVQAAETAYHPVAV